MSLQDIHQYFQSLRPIYLDQEVAVCYILAALIDEGDSYGTALMKNIKAKYPPYQISDTVLYKAVKFLTAEGLIQAYWQNLPGRGRPRQMYCIKPEKHADAQQLAQLWYQYLKSPYAPRKAEPLQARAEMSLT